MRIARQRHNEGLAPAEILDQIKALAPADGPHVPHFRRTDEDFRQDALGRIARMITLQRNHAGNDQTLYKLLEWDTTELPNYRRRT